MSQHAPFLLLYSFEGQEWVGTFNRFVDLINAADLLRQEHEGLHILRIYEDGKILLSDECQSEMNAVIRGVRESLRKFNQGAS